MEGYKYQQVTTQPANTNTQSTGTNFNKPSTMLVPVIQIEPSQEDGIIPRAIRGLFARVNQLRDEAQGTRRFTISCSYIQLYNEKIYDLLNTDAYKRNLQQKRINLDKMPGLKLKWTPNEDVIVENLYCFDCPMPEDCLRHFWKGLKNKMMASHRLNNASSRSHCILTL